MRNVTCALVGAMVLFLGAAPPARAWGGYGGHYGYGGYHRYGGHYGYGARHGYRGSYGYPYRSYAFPPADVTPSRPTVYMQQQFYWYHCEDAKAYYPHVQQCPGEWSKVAPSASRPAQ